MAASKDSRVVCDRRSSSPAGTEYFVKKPGEYSLQRVVKILHFGFPRLAPHERHRGAKSMAQECTEAAASWCQDAGGVGERGHGEACHPIGPERRFDQHPRAGSFRKGSFGDGKRH